MLSEAGNFPELAAFYQTEVIQPGNALIRRVLQRGMDSGEFRAVNLDYGSHLVMAPFLFLAVSQQSMGACMPPNMPFDPQTYLDIQVDNLLMGLAVRPPATPSTSSP